MGFGGLEPPLVLASASPRRRDLLVRAGIAVEVVPAAIEELSGPGEAPEALVERLAREKALAVAREVGAPPRRLVLGADTIVVLGDDVLGKPADSRHALELLLRLAGRPHRVLTAVAATETAELRTEVRVVESVVRMRAASRTELEAYVASGESLDKAGAYAAQGEGRRLIAGIEGSETNVIGLPIEETLGLLRAAGLLDERAA